MAENKQAPGTPVRDRALAAWESAAVRTLDPRLTPAQSKGVWGAVLKLREHKDVEKFLEDAAKAISAAPSDVQQAFAAVVANLRDVMQIQT